MNQPESYDNEPELVKWLKYNLQSQRDEGIAEESLVLI